MAMNIKNLRIESPDFPPLGHLRDRHAGDKGNVPPQLRISGVPAGTVELAVICHDPDAPLPHGFTHWTIYGIRPGASDPVGADAGSRTGPSGTGASGYTDPWPPAGHGLHHYYFWVYALSRSVEGSPGREAFLSAYGDHVIEQNRVVGLYENP